MPAIVKLQLSLETLAEAISSLDLEEKCQLQEIIEQQIFEAEEALYDINDENQLVQILQYKHRKDVSRKG
ncbi:hypothetical protein IQ247_07125 [Plectonema cf. radiosum LEGE 06105]|uniref:Uncharacterized protein n=1 Tax=Plectonema cf. radiosum LEGE 06105 TaxID=945769 RepID=A0A8J7FDY1_9CYAN|nr:hypothetical protein [Plectonema radiosum]MBE9212486.1 hypothetical protein [Plectonema cf. radiosum LEGE 06105]